MSGRFCIMCCIELLVHVDKYFSWFCCCCCLRFCVLMCMASAVCVDMFSLMENR